MEEVSNAEGAATSNEIKAARSIQGYFCKMSSLPYAISIGIMPPKKK
eukprot:CAMPEP_0196216026 /NCGR_PEP_ID=MMETSP0912-20130531/31340_1 /TAXON_ID=49265 /ORGANISM="Thalassiosira rotula, Strain GSO102" /LENGTH=46 /DNA_ID= /DNA_START= /DNA_END= /DNA_ORIENTATION=